MSKMIQVSAFLFLLIFSGARLYSKPFYQDGNYSEAGGAPHMCMRCHMGILNPAGTSMTMKSSSNNIKAGDTVDVTVSISGFLSDWNPGIGIFVNLNNQYAVNTPQEWGWEVVESPNNNRFSYIKSKPGAKTFLWKLKAPSMPGAYRIATSGYFADYSKSTPVMGTKRGDNSLVINVEKSQSFIKPLLVSVAGRYKNFVFMNFSAQMDSTEAVNISNYEINEKYTDLALTIIKAFPSRDRKTIILQTADQKHNNAYTITVSNLKDYSLQPKIIDNISTDFKADLSVPYKIYAEWSQDVTQTELKQSDMTEFVGNISNEIYRTNLCFSLPDNPVDLLPVSGFTSARLYLFQKEVKGTSAKEQQTESHLKWNLYKLLPGNDWTDYVGNNQSVQTNWSGYNQQEPPVASLYMDLDSKNDRSYWVWDITNNFTERFKNLGGTGTNTNNYFLRIKADDEKSISGCAGFAGSDDEALEELPHIELAFDTISTSLPIEEINLNKLRIYPNPTNDCSVILYQIYEYGDYKLSLYDDSGCEVTILEEGTKDKGSYTYDLQPSMLKFSNGLYFVRLKTKERIETGKIEILK